MIALRLDDVMSTIYGEFTIPSVLTMSPAKAGFYLSGNCQPSAEALGYFQTSATRTKSDPSITVG